MDEPSISLESLEAAVRAGRGAELLARWDLRAVRDAALHAAVAALAERAGVLDRAVLEYNLALRDEPTRLDVLRRLAELRLDQGDHERAIRGLRRIVELDPEDAEARATLAALLEEAGASGAAERARGEVSAPAPPAEEAMPGDAECLAFSRTFAGREGTYARQWVSPSGKAGYSPIHAPLTAEVARRHLMGDETVGVYPLRADDTVRWMAIDVDIAQAKLRAARGGELEALRGSALEAARRLADTASARGFEPLIEDSGHKGYHVWILFAEWLPAAAARRLGRAFVDRTRLDDLPITTEVFPKQSKSPPDGLGNLIKLPLGIHRLTGRRCPLLGPDRRPHLDPFGALERARRATAREVLAALRPEPEGEPVAPIVLEYELAADPEVAALRRGCAVLDALIRTAEHTRTLDEDQRNVITYTIGNLERGADAVNAILAKTLNTEPRLFLKRPLRGHPMSCPKIRKRLPLLSARVGCDCAFEATASYPHPLLHAGADEGPTSPQAPASPPPSSELARYLELSQQLSALREEAEALSTRLAAGITKEGLSAGGRRFVAKDGRLVEVEP